MPLVLFILKLHQDPDLFSKIVNGFVEFMVDKPGQVNYKRKPKILFHSPQIVTHCRLPGISYRPRVALFDVVKERMNKPFYTPSGLPIMEFKVRIPVPWPNHY